MDAAQHSMVSQDKIISVYEVAMDRDLELEARIAK